MLGRTCTTIEASHFFVLRLLKFGSLRPLPKPELEKKQKPLPDKKNQMVNQGTQRKS